MKRSSDRSSETDCPKETPKKHLDEAWCLEALPWAEGGAVL